MKNKILTTAILLTGLLSANTYNYTLKISDINLFNNSQSVSNEPTMQNATPLERTGIISTGVPLAEDGGVVWYGEVLASNFITGNQLASILNFSSGTSQNSNTNWLHIGLDGKELFIPKKTIRRGVRFQWLDENNLVDGQRTVEINGEEYIVRLIKSVSPEITTNLPTNTSLLYDPIISKNSEYNRIFYRLHNGVFNNSSNKTTTQEPFERLAFYSEEDLGFLTSNGGATIVKERSQSTTYVYIRGANLTHMGSITIFDGSQINGWRQVLEKIN